jgi:hypothetical protein
MTRFRRVASALAVSSAVVGIAVAQAPSSPSTSGTEPNQPRPAAVKPQLHPKRRSIVHHYPYPYPGYYNYDQTAGYRNPGGVGRYAEYYPPGNQFQVEQDPVRVAGFDRGGATPNWDQQRAAQQVGIARYNSIQQSIDRYAAPRYGVGYFGGFF